MTTPKAQHTPGPWRFELNPVGKRVVLISDAPMRPFVMGFARYGMQGAQPLFPVDSFMEKASEIATPEPGREHHAEWHRIINHPNARLIAAAPELAEHLETICKLVDACQLYGPADVLREHVRAAQHTLAKLHNGVTP